MGHVVGLSMMEVFKLEVVFIIVLLSEYPRPKFGFGSSLTPWLANSFSDSHTLSFQNFRKHTENYKNGSLYKVTKQFFI